MHELRSRFRFAANERTNVHQRSREALLKAMRWDGSLHITSRGQAGRIRRGAVAVSDASRLWFVVSIVLSSTHCEGVVVSVNASV